MAPRRLNLGPTCSRKEFRDSRIAPRWLQDGPSWAQDGAAKGFVPIQLPQDGSGWPKLRPAWPRKKFRDNLIAPKWLQDGHIPQHPRPGAHTPPKREPCRATCLLIRQDLDRRVHDPQGSACHKLVLRDLGPLYAIQIGALSHNKDYLVITITGVYVQNPI